MSVSPTEVLISCDWGTSSFRLYLVQASDGAILQEVREGLGIKDLHAQWQHSGRPARLDFYLQYLRFRIYLLAKKAQRDLDAVPVFISGMASSSIGMMELPYAALPFSLDGRDLVREVIRTEGTGPAEVCLISGLCSPADVMRGEETQLIGLEAQFAQERAIAILPGTHSKHVYIANGQIEDFRTYMTGEFFAMLCSHSILQNSVAASEQAGPREQEYFRKGVETAMSRHLLSASFRVRTNELLHQVSKSENYHYLSGLLIGSELNDLPPGVQLYLVGGGRLQKQYIAALDCLGRRSVQALDPQLVDAAVAAAHARICSNLS